jgi:ABC-type transport system involved in cytochrome c biogenesis permease subunit
MKKVLPWIVVGVCALWVLAAGRSPRDKTGFHLAEFGRLPVLLNGRVQPMDSVARNTLLQMRSRQSVHDETEGTIPAIAWFAELTMKGEGSGNRKAFRVDHPELRSLVGLPPEGSMYASYAQLEPHFEAVDKQARRAGGVESAQRSTFEKAVLKLHNGLSLYQRLRNSLRPEDSHDFRAELAEFQAVLEPGLAAVQQHEAGETVDQAALTKLARMVQRYQMLAQVAYPLIIPPDKPEVNRDAWSNIGSSLFDVVRTKQISPAATAYADMVTAYQDGKPGEFNQALADYQNWLAGRLAPEVKKARFEHLFNHWRPFYLSTTIYVLAFLLGCGSWFGWQTLLNRSGFYLLVLGLVVHTAGIIFRMTLEGRPPVTNLYSSAVFVGWGAVVLGVILERIYRDSVGLVMAATIGFVTQIIAHNLALGGDTMEMMRAVLDSNFWLTTHVITITLGYSAAFVAGFLGILYVLRGVLTRGLGPEARASLGRMVYGTICFATLFSFVGTVLGGIWADQSWGRFWGWDPKENGALIIVLWNALILHARWGGLVRERGLMNLAIFGNVVTSFSWFGVNMLGVGLHSYGFMDKAAFWLYTFMASQILLIVVGLLPEKHWASFRQTPAMALRGKPQPSPA